MVRNLRVESRQVLLWYAERFLTAGNCTSYVYNSNTDKGYFYRIKRKESTGSKAVWYVYTRGMMSSGKATYSGCLFFDGIEYTMKIKQDGSEEDNVAMQGLLWLLNRLTKKMAVSPNVKVFHIGRCSVCNRRLTNEESLMRGIGSECIKKFKRE